MIVLGRRAVLLEKNTGKGAFTILFITFFVTEEKLKIKDLKHNCPLLFWSCGCYFIISYMILLLFVFILKRRERQSSMFCSESAVIL